MGGASWRAQRTSKVNSTLPTCATHLLDLLLLAPDIQEAVLFLEAVEGRAPLGERGLRAIAHAGTWEVQRERWCEVKPSF
ncbi:hypothetical protein [Myxococcus sp. AB056]|uniref:hypothetical protein n=1 Tax=Myxococcus sp. AB056 TaxID=2562792 RepID=UPI001E5299F8|nr:hypothetical protein [Myxococcus sp. AB056]